MAYNLSIKELLEEAWAKRREGKYDEARHLVKEAQGICKDDDHNFLGRIFHIYMQFESDQDNYSKALEFCQKSLWFYRKDKNLDKIAHSTRHIADLQRHLGQEADSEGNYREAIANYKGNSNTYKGDLANALRGFGLLLEKRGKIEEAIAIWKETKELYLGCYSSKQHCNMLNYTTNVAYLNLLSPSMVDCNIFNLWNA